MLTRVRIWQLMLYELIVAVCATAILGFLVHYPDITRRPMPPPKSLFFVLIFVLSLVVLTLAVVGVRSSQANTALVIFCSVAIWLLGCYGLVFEWINTFGT